MKGLSIILSFCALAGRAYAGGPLPELYEAAAPEAETPAAAKPGAPAADVILENNLVNPETPQAPHYPDCSSECQPQWIGDGWCDAECNHAECDLDGGDCKGWCRSECPPSWLGDGQCDIHCYSEECLWDKGDCQKLRDEGKKGMNLDPEEERDVSECLCPAELLSNGVCDESCNNYACGLDGLDCLNQCNAECPIMWLKDGTCDRECDTESCMFDKGDCAACDDVGECRRWMLGNKICDMACLTDSCFQDYDDCKGIVDVVELNYDAEPLVYRFCAEENIGDGFCDEACNTEKGKFDGGDCEGDFVSREE